MKLNETQRAFLVMCWARYLPSIETQRAFAETFGVQIDARQVQKFNPEHAAGRDMAARWVTLFHETRAAFLRDVESIPIAHKAYRLRKLQGMLDKALGDGNRPNIPLAASLLEQAAKEAGGSFTNESKVKADVKVKDDAPGADLNTDERRAILSAVIHEAVDKLRAAPPPTDTRH